LFHLGASLGRASVCWPSVRRPQTEQLVLSRRKRIPSLRPGQALRPRTEQVVHPAQCPSQKLPCRPPSRLASHGAMDPSRTPAQAVLICLAAQLMIADGGKSVRLTILGRRYLALVIIEYLSSHRTSSCLLWQRPWFLLLLPVYRICVGRTPDHRQEIAPVSHQNVV
jgi:hypothetical protein